MASEKGQIIVSVHVPGAATPVDVIVALLDSVVQAIEALGQDPAITLEAIAASYRQQKSEHEKEQADKAKAEPVAVPEHGQFRYGAPGGVA